MPELPEVEQVKNSLSKYIINKEIKQITIHVPRLIKYPSPLEFASRLQGRVFVNLNRKGKYLIFTLDNGEYLVIHLRMTGALIFKNQPSTEENKARIVFELNSGVLYYLDTRTLGTLHLVKVDEMKILKGLVALGKEPIDPEFNTEYLAPIFKSKKRLLKAALLDQSIIAGLGNIYVDEALAKTALHPQRLTNSLSIEEITNLVANIKSIIEQAIANHGTTFRDYRDADGATGNNQNFLLVYGRDGQPCTFCGTPLTYAKIAGRGTVYCQRCQKL